MSFILDALKKSEADRQQRSAPNISDVPAGARKAVPRRWLWVLVGLFGINLVVLTTVLINQREDPQAIAVNSTAGKVAEPGREDTSVEDTSAEDTVLPNTQIAARRKNPPASKQVVTAIRSPQDVSEEAPARLPPIQGPTPRVTGTQLTFNDLRASGNLTLPDLNMDIHVYSEKPADRFVFINMQQYRENATLAEGPVLREITAEGVVLEFVGATFLLPRD